jgi:predicted RNA-binding Zn-ribbon protein involved in translation (DUF1610 family)
MRLHVDDSLSYRLAWSCPDCGEELLDGLTHFPLKPAGQRTWLSFYCRRCGTNKTPTGDYEVYGETSLFGPLASSQNSQPGGAS